MVTTSKVTAFINALTDKFENKQINKKDNITGDFSTDTVSYPTVKAVKSWVSSQLSGKADISNVPTKTSDLTNDSGFINSSAITGKEDSSNKVNVWSSIPNDSRYPSEKLVYDSLGQKANASSIPTTTSQLTNDSGFLTQHQDISGKEDKTNKVTSWSSTTKDTNYPSEKLVKSSLDLKADASSVPTKTSDLTNDSGFLTQHQSLDGKTVTVEKQSSAESGYAHTYVIKQGGSQVGSKINIPKDFLVKSGSVKTVTTANNPVSGYVIGDKYIDFVINSKDGSATDEHMYILVSDLVEDTTYTADGTTLQLTNGQFKVKNGGIGTTQLATGVNTSLGYANDWNSSVAKGITQTDITNWNNAVSGGITIGDVDDEIDAYLDAITSALTD